MVNSHLLDVGLRSLRLMVRKVCVQIFERSTKRAEVACEVLPHEGRRFWSSASVVVEEHKSDVVPVLGPTP